MPFVNSVRATFGPVGNKGASRFQNGLTAATAGISAAQIKQDFPSSADGWYWIKGIGTTPYYVYCAMSAGGWVNWIHYRDPGPSGYPNIDTGAPRTTASPYDLTSNTLQYCYTVPSTLLTTARYLAVSSSVDVGASPTSESSFKYVLEFRNAGGTIVFQDMYNWLISDKNANTYGLTAVVSSIERRTNTGNHKRYGVSFNTIQYGHNAGGTTNSEFETFHFRNNDGTGAFDWSGGSVNSYIYQYGGWGVTDGSNPTRGANASWGSFGADQTLWGGSKINDRVFAWFK